MSQEATHLAAQLRTALDPRQPGEVLRALAQDGEIEVRTAVAMNPDAPDDAQDALAGDTDARVRAVLAARLAALCPKLARAEQDDAGNHVMSMLRRLVKDEVERVRAAIAHELQGMAEAPRELILQLANDDSLKIADPVIRLSPVLTADDLIALLSDRLDRASSIAARPMLDGRVCDAIVAQADEAAIRTLLENRGAAISEATLDRLVTQAMPHLCWHSPMVRRPVLSDPSARALACYVSNELLTQLAHRADFGPELAAALSARLAQRMAGQAEPASFWPDADPPPAAALLFAAKLREDGKLGDAVMLTALRRGQRRLAAAMLAAAADIPAGCVQRAAQLRSTKALLSLVWKAGLPARLVVPVQTMLGQIPPSAALTPTRDGGFPLTEDEMRWQITFLTAKHSAARPEVVWQA
jgi:uncharacterized protein (DUF2336 family)